ncbi:MAG: DUF669 domain-containing protein [Methanobrevibacter sp.]|uniref:DUF669 domain-containing protein n=1 Tax=Methanobrevibacter sp. TaxID=66852 RepID=UPI0031F4E99D|nr:DUF669 domain-containing protein [Methanobrevibacter sp.]
MNIFDKWDNEIDTKGLAEDVKSASENKQEFKEVPHGTYEVKVDKMEIKATQKGDPMASVWFKIVDGEYKNQRLFMNQVITQGFQIHIVNEFLRSLDSGLDIEFVNYKQYNDLMLDVLEKIDGKLEYALEYGENKGFDTFKIKEVFDI